MKKIVTKQEQAKKTRRNQLIIGGVLILLMVFSTLGYALSSRSDEGESGKINYNGIEFVKSSEYWYFNIQGQDFITRYNPKEVENISFSSYLSIGNYQDKPLYFVGSGDSVFEIGRNLDSFILRTQYACLVGEECEEDLPTKDCSEDNVIVIKEPLDNGTRSIYQNDNCIFIIADYINQTKYADAFIFEILGI